MKYSQQMNSAFSATLKKRYYAYLLENEIVKSIDISMLLICLYILEIKPEL